MEDIIIEPVKVYIKVNKDNFITEIISSDFLEDTTGYIKIDEGFGYKYLLAQNNYLEKSLFNINKNSYVYKYENNKIIYVGD